MTDRLTLIPIPEFVALRSLLRARVERVHKLIAPANFQSLLGPLGQRLLHQTFDQVNADEGTVWLLDEARQHLVPTLNTGPNAERFVLQFRQPIDSGLIGMVVANRMPFAENDVPATGRQDRTLDRLLGVTTTALMAVPFYAADECVGVVSCVQLGRAGTTPVTRFDQGALDVLQLTCGVLSRLLEHQVLTRLIGWSAP